MRMTINAAPQSRRDARRRPVSRRLALVGAVVVLGLTACGSPDSTSDAGPTSTLPAPAVIQVAGSAGGGRGASPMAADASMESSKMMPASLTYTWSGETPDLTSAAASWFFAGGVEPTPEQIQALADAFGVSGDVVELGADMGGGWSVGPNDGTAPAINVAADAMQSWWFSPAWANTAPAVDCAYYPPGDPAGDPSTAEVPACEEPQPPANVPTKAEAETKARELFASLGLDVSQYQFESYADEWSASVTGFLVLDGVRTNVSVNVGFGEEGAVTWAGGFLATPQRGADYPRIGVEAAIQRLNDQSMMWMTGAMPLARDAAVSAVAETGTATATASAGAAVEAAPPASEPAIVEDTAATETTAVDPAGDVAPTDTVLVDPVPVDCTDPAATCLPTDPMEPIVIDLTSVESSLEQVWAEDGTVWLLPGYLFGGAEGAMASVLAVEDQYLVQADPAPVPLPEPMPVETAVPPATAVAPPATAPSALAPFDNSSLIGLSVDEASKLAEQNGRSVRVAREDGVDLALTMDYSETRVNVAVEAGVITEVLNIG